MTLSVCVGGEFDTDGSGRLALKGVPTVPWPFATGSAVPASMQAANGLRVDPVNGPWIPQVGAVPVTQVQRAEDNTMVPFSALASGVYEFVLQPWYVTNYSAYQQLGFTGWVEFGVSVYAEGATQIEQWGNVSYPPAPDLNQYTTTWGPIGSESPTINQLVWHRSSYQSVSMIVDVADQQPITVRHGILPVQGTGTATLMRDWWVSLYGMTYLLDPGPVG